MKIISSWLPPSWLAFLLPASLPLLSLLLPCVFHLLPERVIISLIYELINILVATSIFVHRIAINHHLFHSKWQHQNMNGF